MSKAYKYDNPGFKLTIDGIVQGKITKINSCPYASSIEIKTVNRKLHVRSFCLHYLVSINCLRSDIGTQFYISDLDLTNCFPNADGDMVYSYNAVIISTPITVQVLDKV